MKKIVFIVLCIFLSFLLVLQPAYAADVEVNGTYDDKKIVFLGDSITAGVGVTENSARFGDIVSSTLKFQDYVNMGVSGSTIAIRSGYTNSFAERAPSVPSDADYVIVFGGINDYANDVPLADFTTDIATMIAAIETAAPSSTIIIMTPYDSYVGGTASSVANAVGADLQDYVDIMITASNETADTTPQVNLIDLNSMIGFDASDGADDMVKFTTDGVHANIAGNKRIANILISFFRGENLMQDVTWNDGYYIKNGSSIVSATLTYSSLIPVEEGKTYVYFNGTYDAAPYTSYGQYHDVDGDYVSDLPYTSRHLYQVITIPVGVSYIRLNSESDLLVKADAFVREINNYESFTVTFETNGGSMIDSQLVESGLLATRPVDPTSTTATFVAWYADDEFTTLYDFDTPVTEDITLYAKWATASGVITAPVVETTSYLGIAWYWWVIGVVGVYYFGFTNSGRKFLGLKTSKKGKR